MLILLAIVLIIIFSLFKLVQSKEKTAMQNSSKTKFLCEAKANCDYNKKPPKGVCLPGGVCTSI